jgi:hypothetical protein
MPEVYGHSVEHMMASLRRIAVALERIADRLDATPPAVPDDRVSHERRD